jgi:hypothetical protein
MTFLISDRRTLHDAIEEEKQEEEAKLEVENEDPKKKAMREDGISETLSPIENRRVIVPLHIREATWDRGYKDGCLGKLPQDTVDSDYLAGWMQGNRKSRGIKENAVEPLLKK